MDGARKTGCQSINLQICIRDVAAYHGTRHPLPPGRCGQAAKKKPDAPPDSVSQFFCLRPPCLDLVLAAGSLIATEQRQGPHDPDTLRRDVLHSGHGRACSAKPSTLHPAGFFALQPPGSDISWCWDPGSHCRQAAATKSRQRAVTVQMSKIQSRLLGILHFGRDLKYVCRQRWLLLCALRSA